MEKEIAIVGVAVRFPQADDLEAFYHNLATGKDSILPVSDARIRNTTLPLDKDYLIQGTLENIDQFDPAFFGISQGEAEHMDPHQRLILQTAQNAFDNAGYARSRYAGTQTGVYVGDVKLKYQQHIDQINQTSITGNSNPALAGRIARFFDLQGPALMIDTACSSSLVALHMACRELRFGQLSHMLVCGVYLNLFPLEEGDSLSTGMVAPDGRPRPFSDDANGTGLGEGVAALLLKPLSKAQADGDIIHAIIKGSATNQDAARSGSLSAPSAVAQTEVIQAAWQDAEINPRTITYIEAHGTGTKLGDPIELEGINTAFRASTDDRNFCAIGSVKSNIGHTISVAGLAGLVKVILSFQHQQLFPSIRFASPNRYFDFDNSAVRVNTTLQSWKSQDGAPLRAGVSSFGISGTNCHVVLEAAPPQPPGADSLHPQLLCISGKTDSALHANLKALKAFLEVRGDWNLSEVCHSLVDGRDHYARRFVKVVSSKEELLAALSSDGVSEPEFPHQLDGKNLILVFSDGQTPQSDLITQMTSNHPEFAAAWQTLKQHIPTDPELPNFQRFALQYCFYQLLKARQIQAPMLVGDGLGRITVSVITGERSLAAAIPLLQNYQAQTGNDIPARTRKLLQRAEQAPTLFIEMGPDGNISDEILKQQTPASRFHCLQLDPGAKAPFLAFVRDLYLSGYPMDLGKLMGSQVGARRIPLPGYQFDAHRTWIKAVPTAHAQAWLYQLNWTPDSAGQISPASLPQQVLIFADEQGWASELATMLATHNIGTVLVRRASKFSWRTGEAALDWTSAAHYTALKEQAAAEGIVFDALIHFGAASLSPGSEASTEAPTNLLLDLLHLVQAFESELRAKQLSFLAITKSSRQVQEQENILFPAGSVVHGFVSSLIEEYPGAFIRALEFADRTLVATSILQELSLPGSQAVVAYRAQQRFLPVVEHMAPTVNPGSIRKLIQKDACYMVTGGTSGIGQAICNWLCDLRTVKLVVVGRSILPPKSVWAEAHQADTAIQGRIAALVEMEKAGAEVHYFAVDVSNRSAMHALQQQLRELDLTPQGLFHAAGLPGRQRVSTHSPDSFQATLAPKIQGSIYLDEFWGKALDFSVYCSSHNAVVGQARNTNYSAANMFQDSFAQFQAGRGKRYFSINWPAWKETGMWQRYHAYADLRQADDLAILTADGIAALQAILESGQSNVIVSIQDPNTIGSNPFFHVPGSTPVAAPPPAGPEPEKQAPAALQLPFQIELWTETEQSLAHIWHRILKMETLTLEDDFFDLGGHSLYAVQLVNAIEDEFQVELEFNDLFDYATIRELGEFIDSKQPNLPRPSAGILPLPASDSYAVSAAQRRFWLLDQIDASASIYHMPTAFRYRGTLDEDAFATSLAQLEARHEILRTTFKEAGGNLVQCVAPAGLKLPALEVIDVSGADDPEMQARQQIFELARLTFDLKEGPLWRCVLLRLSQSEIVIFFSTHHIISDRQSMNVIRAELFTFYEALQKGKAAVLSPLPFQYKAFAHWQNQWLETEAASSSRAYWHTQFQHPVPLLNIPLDFARPETPHFESGSVHSTYTFTKFQALEDLGKRYESSLFAVLLACLAKLLYQISGQRDFGIGMPVTGRDRKSLENQVGLYINTVALRPQFSESEVFSTLIRQAQELIANALQYMNYPFDRLVDELKLPRVPGRSPLFDIIVQYSEIEAESEEFSTFMENIDVVNKADLSFYFVVRATKLVFTIEYRTDLFRESRIQYYHTLFAGILDHILAHPDSVVSHFPDQADSNDGTPEEGGLDMEINL